jgi:pimeloyl-ACP methyl ester carboxylesterase
MSRTLCSALLCLVTLATVQLPTAVAAPPPPPPSPPVVARTVIVDGVPIHYTMTGQGAPLILIHGYTQTSRMWNAALPELAKRFTVIVPDLPGFGESGIPTSGMDMKTAAQRIHALARALQVQKARVVGHDIGLMVAYAYAAQFPNEVERLVLMDAFLPGIGDWERSYHDPKFWHLVFIGPTPEALVKGRERTYFDHYWNDFAANPNHSLSQTDREVYTASYSRPGRMRAGWTYFANIPLTAKDFAQFATEKLTMPVLVIAGAKAAGEGLVRQTRMVATNVQSVVLANTGHWVLEENPQGTMAALESFL